MCFGITNSQTRDTIVPKLSDNEFQELKKEYLEVSKTNLVKRKTHFERLYFYRRSIWTPSYDFSLYITSEGVRSEERRVGKECCR